jgi:O-Antigen ligase
MASLVRPAIAGRAGRLTPATTALAVVLAVLVGLATVKLGSFQHQLKALIIVTAGLALVVAALRPDYGLVILLALIPFGFGFYGTGSDNVLLLALPLVMMWRIRAGALPPWVAIGGLTLVAGSFITILGAHNKSNALEGAADWLGAILILFVALTVLRERRDASRRMVDIFTGSAVIVVIFGFLQKAGIDTVVGAPYNPGLPNSFFAYYTVYAGYVAMAATLATAEILIALDERKAVRASTYGAVLVLMLAALAQATSRGGIVALAVGWLVFLVLNVRRGPTLARAVSILAIFAAAGYVATPAATIARIEHRFVFSNGTQREDKTRFALHKAGEQALSTHPFGLGYGNFAYYLSSSVRSSNIGQAFFHAHETPIQIGLDAGWIGLAGFLVLFAGPILLVFIQRGGGMSTVRASAFAAALAGFMAQGLYDYFFYDTAFFVFFVALVWGTVHSLSVESETNSRHSRPTLQRPALQRVWFSRGRLSGG